MAWHHSRTYRSAVPVRAASSALVAGPPSASARHRPTRSPMAASAALKVPARAQMNRPAKAPAPASSIPAGLVVIVVKGPPRGAVGLHLLLRDERLHKSCTARRVAG